MPDLLDFLNAQDEPAVVHVIMPSMSLACGYPILDALRAGDVDGLRRTTLAPGVDATCPKCLAPGLDGIRAEMARQQGRQAQILD